MQNKKGDQNDGLKVGNKNEGDVLEKNKLRPKFVSRPCEANYTHLHLLYLL